MGAASAWDIGLSQWSLEYVTVALYTMTKTTSILFIMILGIFFKLERKHWSQVRLVNQALFLCNICVVFRAVLPYGDLLFIHASTNTTDGHKYSPLHSADFDSSGVLVLFSVFFFS